MADPSEITNAGLSDDARTFTMPIAVPVPLEGQAIAFYIKAPYDVEIISFRHSTSTGSLEATLTIGGVVVDMEEDDSFGFVGTLEDMVALPGTLTEYVPTSSLPQDSIVDKGQKLVLTLRDVESDVDGYEAELTLRRTQVNF